MSLSSLQMRWLFVMVNSSSYMLSKCLCSVVYMSLLRGKRCLNSSISCCNSLLMWLSLFIVHRIRCSTRVIRAFLIIRSLFLVGIGLLIFRLASITTSSQQRRLNLRWFLLRAHFLVSFSQAAKLDSCLS